MSEKEQETFGSEPRSLVELLTEPCPYCPPVRAALAQLAEARPTGGVHITATVLWDTASNKNHQQHGMLRHDLQVECDHCHGTQRVPAKMGNQLLWFLRWFADEVAKVQTGRPPA